MSRCAHSTPSPGSSPLQPVLAFSPHLECRGLRGRDTILFPTPHGAQESAGHASPLSWFADKALLQREHRAGGACPDSQEGAGVAELTLGPLASSCPELIPAGLSKQWAAQFFMPPDLRLPMAQCHHTFKVRTTSR